MSDTPRYRTLRDYLRVLRARRWLIVLITVVVGGGSYLLWSNQEETYRAEASLSFKDPVVDEGLIADPALPRRTPEYEAAIGAETVSSPEVAQRVRRALRLRASADSLLADITARRESTTNLVVIEAEAGRAVLAARLANAFARQTRAVREEQERRRIDRVLRTYRRNYRGQRLSRQSPLTRLAFEQEVARLESLRDIAEPVDIVELAGVPESAASPNVGVNTTLGILFGLTLGVMAAFIRDALDLRLRGVQQIQSELDLPILASISASALGKRQFRGKRAPTEADLEAFRILRRNLDLLVRKPIHSVAVTSAAAEEGKSTVAVSLAWAYATARRRTLLIDCDLRRGGIAERVGVRPTPGLSDYLAERAHVQDILHTVSLEDASGNGLPPGDAALQGAVLTCIPGGSRPRGPAELLESSVFHDFLGVVGRSFDHVVIDTSPLLPVADTLELLPLVDGVIICVRSSRTRRDQAGALRAALGNFPDLPAGLVVTAAPRDDYPTYGYYAATGPGGREPRSGERVSARRPPER